MLRIHPVRWGGWLHLDLRFEAGVLGLQLGKAGLGVHGLLTHGRDPSPPRRATVTGMSEDPGFGEVLPTTSSDEDEIGWGADPTDSPDDDLERLRREVPPHHGD